jgi:hypothetical protein
MEMNMLCRIFGHKWKPVVRENVFNRQIREQGARDMSMDELCAHIWLVATLMPSFPQRHDRVGSLCKRCGKRVAR